LPAKLVGHKVLPHRKLDVDGIVTGYKRGLKKFTVKYYKSSESNRCSKKVDTTREELVEILVYLNSNDESDYDEVSVDSIDLVDMEEYMSYLSEILSIYKDDIDAYLGAVEREHDISSNSESDSSSDG
jgi:hypothetical protein